MHVEYAVQASVLFSNEYVLLAQGKQTLSAIKDPGDIGETNVPGEQTVQFTHIADSTVAEKDPLPQGLQARSVVVVCVEKIYVEGEQMMVIKTCPFCPSQYLSPQVDASKLFAPA